MPLETASFISDLNASNPAHSDGLNQADAHMRLIKAALKSTFPSITGPVTASQADLNAITGLLTAGVTALADSGAFFKTPGAGGPTGFGPAASATQLNFYTSGVQAGAMTVNGLTLIGGLTTSGAISGPGVVPIGSTVIWWSDVLPTQGTWCWANGGVLPRTGAGAALFALIGTTYGAGDGSTTFNVPNLQEVVPVGKSTMGGAASSGLLGSIASGVKAVLGSIMGADTHTLTASQIPAITASGSMSGTASGSISGSAASVILGGTSGGGGVGGGGTFGLSGNASVSGSFSGSASVSGSVSSTNTGGGAHNNVQPSRVVNYIIRIG